MGATVERVWGLRENPPQDRDLTREMYPWKSVSLKKAMEGRKEGCDFRDLQSRLQSCVYKDHLPPVLVVVPALGPHHSEKWSSGREAVRISGCFLGAIPVWLVESEGGAAWCGQTQ